MSEIKAIETRYKGYRFRSRLEARWAIAFDQMGLPWEYEPEGYALPGGNYLPDFRLPFGFVEIKAKGMRTERSDLLVCELYSLTGTPAFIIDGDPYPEAYHMDQAVGVSGHWTPGAVASLHCCEFRSCRRCDGICIAGTDDFFFVTDVGAHSCKDHDRYPVEVAGKLLTSFVAARSARFEHGERP